MNFNTFGFILTGILLNASAQLLLKKGTNAVGAIHLTAENWFATGVQLATQLPIIGGLACYVISVVVWIIGLSRVDVTIAYPLLSIGYIVNAFGAWYFLGEIMSLQRMLAIAIIIIGVALLVKS
ncbi:MULTISPECIES: EamA family transporter [unclassified Undibacterium]|uniref:EamA family transporter n=1 Tax=unclassified Undibacterium TaxID=2630295 RepID=UPI002AC8F46D|nr:MULTISPECIES: EamA family transporter [unclassified Undibacterium]MEB0139675.1 4-amino-4-deoxy-L-arabinose transferase [Undibacterium sp. CCC2.1]MEB0172556.1 4-amino-4-deoxy-L-arabinose transferase [Undibacterium sp. CCC1.1]MEB0176348.1 4-amino-4-deoxy-L-arabinose transferase [Undibacterium sp. CCC3.4]MEB0215682.1 4-amino-4-deoxy-L-arabinose transferase [Undibacterium sp. 5I2]WPX42960.1 4-amino-4-deoxy-L-arabinose transferase [Undibacterium sp. CCC3.4]